MELPIVETRCIESMIESKCLKDEVLRLSTIVNQHSKEINNIEQYSRRECAKISHLPEESNKNTNALAIIKVASLMGLNLSEKDISISHCLRSSTQNQSYSSRLGPRDGSAPNKVNPANRFAKVIVKLMRREMKEQFYHGCKHLTNK